MVRGTRPYAVSRRAGDRGEPGIATIRGIAAIRGIRDIRYRAIPDRYQGARANMEISLTGRAALITGGSKGIGLAVATRFAASGGDVAIVARGREALAAAAATIAAAGRGRVVPVQGDVAVPADIERAYGETMKAFGKIDILMNNAGESRTGAFEEISEETWRADFDQKLFAAIRLARLVWPQMKERRWGR